MTLVPLSNGWRLAVLEANERSPMEQHGAMEIAADDERQLLWAYAPLVHTYGLASVLKSCASYTRATLNSRINEFEKEPYR